MSPFGYGSIVIVVFLLLCAVCLYRSQMSNRDCVIGFLMTVFSTVTPFASFWLLSHAR